MIEKFKILGVSYHNITMTDALNLAESLLHKKSKSNIFFLNEDYLYKSIKDEEYKIVLNNSTLLLSDGIGLKIATKILGGKMKDNCNGTDFIPEFLKIIAKNKLSVFFLGAREGDIQKAIKFIKKQTPSLKIAGFNNGYFTDEQSTIDKINKSKADILIVSMGAPKQEKWINKNRKRLNPKICIGIGGTFDIWSGRISRPPLWIRKLNLGWLVRVFQDPGRLFKRYFIEGFILFIRIVKERLRRKNVQ